MISRQARPASTRAASRLQKTTTTQVHSTTSPASRCRSTRQALSRWPQAGSARGHRPFPPRVPPAPYCSRDDEPRGVAGHCGRGRGVEGGIGFFGNYERCVSVRDDRRGAGRLKRSSRVSPGQIGSVGPGN